MLTCGFLSYLAVYDETTVMISDEIDKAVKYLNMRQVRGLGGGTSSDLPNTSKEHLPMELIILTRFKLISLNTVVDC